MEAEQETREHNDVVGFFLIRDGVILQSVTELYDGPYTIQVHQIKDGEHTVNEAGIGPSDALLPIDKQAIRLIRYLVKAIEDPENGEGNRLFIVGGKAKLFDQLLLRVRDIPAFSKSGMRMPGIVYDHVEILFRGNGSRALSLGERIRLSDLEFLKTFLGRTDLDWFRGLYENTR